MDAVLADAAADHDDQITRVGALLMRRLPLEAGRHDAASAAEHQGFSEKALIEENGPIDVRNATLVGAVLYPTMHPSEHALRMHESRRQRLGIVRRRKA